MIILLPDGIEMEVPIEYLDVKDGLFVPTLKMPETKVILKRIARGIQIDIEVKNAIEDGYLGVMAWRVR
jgi:hypothetical protein